jgi:hypothetical protein
MITNNVEVVKVVADFIRGLDVSAIVGQYASELLQQTVNNLGLNDANRTGINQREIIQSAWAFVTTLIHSDEFDIEAADFSKVDTDELVVEIAVFLAGLAIKAHKYSADARNREQIVTAPSFRHNIGYGVDATLRSGKYLSYLNRMNQEL